MAGTVAVFLATRPPSAAKIMIATYLCLLIVPIVPAFQDQGRKQIGILLAVAILGYVAGIRLALRRKISLSLVGWVTAIPALLSFVTVGLIDRADVRLETGALTGVAVGLSILLGRISESSERRTILIAFTIFGEIMAAIALLEILRQAPLYEYTAFQVHEGTGVAFRASAFLGHPLVLATVLVAVAIFNLARPEGRYPLVVRSRALSVAVPLFGAAATASRSVVVMIVIGVIFIAVSRRPRSGTGSRRGFALTVLAASTFFVWTAVLDPNSSLGQRMRELSVAQESVRLSAFDVVRGITSGWAMLIGNGPSSVAAAAGAGSPIATFGTVDNQMLDFYADYGIIGVVGLAILIVIVLRGVRREGLDSWRQASLLAGSVPIVAMLFFDALSWPAVAAVFGYAVGSSLLPAASLEVLRDASQEGNRTEGVVVDREILGSSHDRN